ncbi:MAG: MFS transporter [Pseudomonadota bacterium]
MLNRTTVTQTTNPLGERLSGRLAAHFSAIYAAHFVFLGVLLPFFSGWLALAGFSPSAIGLINGIALALRLIFAPAIAQIADQHTDKRKPLLWMTLILVTAAGLTLVGGHVAIIAVGAAGMIFAFGLMVPLMDSLVLRADRNGLVTYGPIRAVGTFAFLTANVALGFYFRQAGFGPVALVLFFAALAGVGVTLILPSFTDTAQPPDGDHPHRRAFWADAWRLVSNPIFLVALFAAGLTQAAHAVYYAYSVLHWPTLGYSSLTIGWLWSVGVMAEIVLLSLARPLARRLGVARLLAIGALAAGVRWAITATEPTLSVLFCLQTLHALTFGAAYLGAVEFVDRAVPMRLVNTGMVIFSTTGVGALTGVATIIAGFVFEGAGPAAAYGLMAILGFTALGLAVVLGRVWHGQKLFG